MFEMEVNSDTKLVFVTLMPYQNSICYHLPRPRIVYGTLRNILELDTTAFDILKREAKFFRVGIGKEVLYRAALAPELNTVFVALDNKDKISYS